MEALAREGTDIDGENPFDVYKTIPGDEVLGILYRTEDLKESAINSGQILSEEARAEAQRVVAQVVTDGMSGYDIVKALHDYLIWYSIANTTRACTAAIYPRYPTRRTAPAW